MLKITPNKVFNDQGSEGFPSFQVFNIPLSGVLLNLELFYLLYSFEPSTTK